MQDINRNVFEMTNRFRQLRLVERLGLIPRSELSAMETIRAMAAEWGSAGVSDLARVLHVSAPAASRTVKRLRERGFAECEEDEHDRRNARVTLTPAGIQALEENRKQMDEFMNGALSRLSGEELEQFFQLFNKIFDGMQAELELREARQTDHNT